MAAAADPPPAGVASLGSMEGGQDDAASPGLRIARHLLPTTVARREGSCLICDGAIQMEDRVFPHLRVDDAVTGWRYRWAHAECADRLCDDANTVPIPPTCRHWLRRGHCPMLDAEMCAFWHPPEAQGAAKDSGKRRWGGRRRQVRNQYRHTSFRIWLVKQYGLDLMLSGPVLDVAGGHGWISWELVNCVGVNAVIVDPRPMETGPLAKKWAKGLYEPWRTGPVFSRWNPAVQNGDGRARPCVNPPHARIFFNAESFVRLSHELSADAAQVWLAKETTRGHNTRWTIKGLQSDAGDDHEECAGHADDEPPAKEEGGYNGGGGEAPAVRGPTEIDDANALRDIVGQTKLVIGMHPDQAAGEAAQFAVAQKLPWAVVPCCVYRKEFPNRRLHSGATVSTYQDLVEWLSELHPNTRRETLDFEGRNTVVYMLPSDYE